MTAEKEKEKALELAIGQIERQFGRGAVMRLGDLKNTTRIASISTGSIALDLALGIGGIPRGRVTEIYGAEASGKSTLAYHIMAEAQRAGGTAAYIDAEHALDPGYATKCGLDAEELLVSQPDTAEQALEICEYLVRSGAVDVADITNVVLDFGTDGSGHGGDVDGSGTVDIDDVVLVVLNFGACPAS